jgi:ABC-2 type transport system permease protein
MITAKILTIAVYTFRELFKSKILLNVFFIGLGLALVTYVATEFTYGVPERVALDFGLGMLSLSSLAISLFLGVTLLAKEIESRTVYMVIARPVPRSAFIVGKIIGLLGIQVLNVAVLSALTLGSTALLGGEVTSILFWAIGFILLESLLLLLSVVLISLLANTILSVLFSVVLLILGHAVKETQNLSFVKNKPALQVLLDAYHFLLPAYHKLNIKDFVIYERSLPLDYLLPNLAYALVYSLGLLCLIIFLFHRKNLD